MNIDHRRGFLRGLVSLPLIGGGVTLIGQPSGVAEPITINLLDAYKTWLDYERRWVAWEMAERPEIVAYYGGDRNSRFDQMDRLCHHVGKSGSFHSGSPPASTRAALVLSAVGCDWRA